MIYVVLLQFYCFFEALPSVNTGRTITNDVQVFPSTSQNKSVQLPDVECTDLCTVLFDAIFPRNQRPYLGVEDDK
jgi:hypothetical protein